MSKNLRLSIGLVTAVFATAALVVSVVLAAILVVSWANGGDETTAVTPLLAFVESPEAGEEVTSLGTRVGAALASFAPITLWAGAICVVVFRAQRKKQRVEAPSPPA